MILQARGKFGPRKLEASVGFMAVGWSGRESIPHWEAHQVAWYFIVGPELLGRLHGHVDEGEESIVRYPGAVAFQSWWSILHKAICNGDALGQSIIWNQ